MPTVTWYRDDVLMAGEAFTTAQQRSVQSEITVGPLGRQDLNTRLTCRAINHPRALPVESTVLLDMNCEYITHKYMVNISTRQLKHMRGERGWRGRGLRDSHFI